MINHNLFIVIILFMFICVVKISYSWAVEKKAANYWYKEYSKKVKEEEGVIKQSVQRSLNTQRSVIKGQIGEQMFPYIMYTFYGYKLADFNFFGGKPIDYVVFPGMSENNTQEIIFADVKTGNAKLTETQERIKYLIEIGKVRWITFRISDDGYVVQE